MKKYGGGSYFPSGAPGREERREEDYPQGKKIFDFFFKNPQDAKNQICKLFMAAHTGSQSRS